MAIYQNTPKNPDEIANPQQWGNPKIRAIAISVDILWQCDGNE